jgi:hypothetical protein
VCVVSRGERREKRNKRKEKQKKKRLMKEGGKWEGK